MTTAAPRRRGYLSRLGGLALWLVLLCLPGPAGAVDLVMFHEYGCPWCEAWEEEIGVFYHKTDEAKRAPLRRLDIADDLPEDLQGLDPVNFTPTFVVVDEGREVGRISGYPGHEFFWYLLGEILDKAGND